MAWTDPNTYIAGAILTAAQLNAMQANALAGGPIYTTLAALNTAIPSPFEGQRAYLTAPAVGTVTAAGADTAVPVGISVIYNGTAWVCTTPVGSHTDASGTTTSAAYTATLSGTPGTNPSVTTLTGATALVMIATGQFAGGGSGAMSFAVSGATTVAASTNYGVQTSSAGGSDYARTFVLTGLTAGVNTFTLQYNAAGGGTQTFARRNITVQGIA